MPQGFFPLRLLSVAVGFLLGEFCDIHFIVMVDFDSFFKEALLWGLLPRNVNVRIFRCPNNSFLFIQFSAVEVLLRDRYLITDSLTKTTNKNPPWIYFNPFCLDFLGGSWKWWVKLNTILGEMPKCIFYECFFFILVLGCLLFIFR